MSIRITISEEEILKIPNDCELGETIRNNYRDEKAKIRTYFSDDEHFPLEIGPDGSVIKIMNSSDDFYDQKDKCVICGKESPYLRSTNIYERIGYVEGGGQGCFQPNICS